MKFRSEQQDVTRCSSPVPGTVPRCFLRLCVNQINQLSPLLFTGSQQGSRNQVKSTVRSLQHCFTPKTRSQRKTKRSSQTLLDRYPPTYHVANHSLTYCLLFYFFLKQRRRLKPDQSETRSELIFGRDWDIKLKTKDGISSVGLIWSATKISFNMEKKYQYYAQHRARSLKDIQYITWETLV